VIRQWLAASATIVTGGSSGPEGPIVTIGAALGSTAGRLARQDRAMTTTLLGAGAAAGIAAVFNAPIAGVFFALEVLLRDFSLRTLAPIVVASVLASATTQTLIGSRHPLFGVDPRILESMREIVTIAASPAFVLLGAACGLVGVLFIRLLRASESFNQRLRIPRILKPALGGLLLGVLGASYVALSMRYGDSAMPVFMGNGYALVDRVVNPALFTGAASGEFALVLLLWLGLKMVATCLTLGSGGSGGLFAPGLVMGALTGGVVGIGVQATGLLPHATPAHFALVGMAGAVAAMMHAPLSGILLVYELTQDYSLILPLMLTATIATLVARSLERESIYTAELAVQGVRLGTRGDASLLKRLTVRDVTLSPPVFVHPDDTADRLLALSERTMGEEFVVVDANERYVGMIGGPELRAAIVYREALALMQVSEVMRSDAPTIRSTETLDVALERMTDGDVGTLAVIDASKRVEGVLTRDRLMRRYHDELECDA
jgi:CIC family chloride channel protein